MTTYQTTVEHYDDTGLVSTEVVEFDLTGEDEVRYLSPDRLQQAYTTLRQWAVDAETESGAWAGQNAAQRDAAMATTFHRLGVFFDRFADLLALEGRS